MGGRLRQLRGASIVLLISVLSCSERLSPYAPNTCACTANLYDCKDFRCQADAQACYERCRSLGRGDIHHLDRDRDGLACEWNRHC